MTTIGNVKVKDAVIDWHVNKSNWPTLIVITEEDVPIRSDFEPVEGSVEDGMFMAQIDGLYNGWQNPSPFSEETSKSYSKSNLELENGNVKVYAMLPHVIRRKLQDQGKDVMKVNVITGFGSSPIRSAVLDIGKVEEIIDKFINGDEGSDNNSYWYRKHNSTRYKPSEDDTEYPVTAEAELEQDKYGKWRIRKK